MKKSSTKIIRILLMIVLVVGVIFVFDIFDRSLVEAPDNDKFYQIMLGKRYDYETTSNVKYQDGATKYLTKDGYYLNLDYTPLYYLDEDKFMMPYDFSVISFIDKAGFIQEKLGHFTTITKEENDYSYVINLDKGHINNGVLYDGQDTYVVLEDAYYIVEDNRIRLSPMSFVYYDSYNDFLVVYDYDLEKIIILPNTINAQIEIIDQDWLIDLTNDSIINMATPYEYRKLLLSNLDFLNVYEN